jgi:hypothetical protein
MADLVNADNEGDNLIGFINQVKDVLGDAPVQGSAIASMTDSSGGTADGTLEAVPSDTLANAATAANNNFAEVNDKVDLILAALRTHGLIAT